MVQKGRCDENCTTRIHQFDIRTAKSFNSAIDSPCRRDDQTQNSFTINRLRNLLVSLVPIRAAAPRKLSSKSNRLRRLNELTQKPFVINCLARPLSRATLRRLTPLSQNGSAAPNRNWPNDLTQKGDNILD
jgi:hypothetical protein